MLYRCPVDRPRRWFVLMAVVSFLMAGADLAGQPRFTDEDIEIAIRRGVDHLWTQQSPDGAWADASFAERYPVGITALVTFTLRTAGISTGDPRMERAIKLLTKAKSVGSTYERSLRAMTYSTLSPERHRSQRNADARWLIARQHLSGAWGYPSDPSRRHPDSGWTDNSNTQFAILGLWQAAMVGSEVSRVTWQKAAKHWLTSQNDDGGWGYRPGVRDRSYGSMTAAGVATCFILYDQLYSRASGRFDGRTATKCGIPSKAAKPVIKAIDAGLDWLGREFVAGANPGIGRVSHLTYYHYSIERAGIASGRKLFGSHDWYHELSGYLLAAQRSNGSWGDLQDTCFALLALVKGRAPILISKVKHGGDWNNDPRDVARFTAWMGRRFERHVAWQIIDLDASDDLHDAPILYFNGHDAPRFSPEQTERLRAFVRKGGTIFAQACCQRSSFIEGATALFNETFPDLQAGPVGPNHPVWTMHFPIKPSYELTAWSDGCRARIFLIKDNLCCAWHRGMTSSYRDRFELGANLVFYATNLSPLTEKRRRFPEPSVLAPVNVLGVARIKHAGDWATDANALDYLSTELTKSCGWALEERPPVDLITDKLDDLPVLWLVGHELDGLTADDADALSRYLRNGGFLIVNAACGRASFNTSFRKWIASIIPPRNWEPVTENHPILRGEPGTPASRLLNLRYKRDAKINGGESSPVRAQIGRIDNRPAVFYSSLDFFCGLDGHPCPRCRGLVTSDARALAVNLLIYFLRQRDIEKNGAAALGHQPARDAGIRQVIEGASPRSRPSTGR